MATPFLGSEEYDERAHRLYDSGDYDRALEVLKDGLLLYPNSVELQIGLGYTRLAREEFIWAKDAFQAALAIEPDHEDALVGLGEVLLRFGRHQESLALFERIRGAPGGADIELLLVMGRALYREHLFHDAVAIFDEAVELSPNSADAHAARAYTLHRLDDAEGALEELYQALDLDPLHHEARIYLGHLLYDRGDWQDALDEFERVPPTEQWDTLAICRLVELKATLDGCPGDHPEVRIWNDRLDELAAFSDPIDQLLAEVERQAQFPR